MSRATKKAANRIRDWREYNQALVKRGSLTVWVDQEAIASWNHSGPNQWGARYSYSDPAITCLLTLRTVFHLPLRATRGLGRSIVELMGLGPEVPHSGTLSRRAAALRVDLARKGKGPPHLVLDSTGLKVFGEGEWEVRRHGDSERRAWRELHPAIDAESHGIQAVALTEAGADDAEVVDHLHTPIDRAVARAAADGAYDQRKVYRVLEPRGARILIPPRSNAQIWKRGNSAGPPLARGVNLRQIRRAGRTRWKREVGYHVRSLAETGVSRLKATSGGHLTSRRPVCQVTEGAIRGRALNRMTHLGMPDSYRAV